MKVEFLKAYEDHTWDTEVIEVPDSAVTQKYMGADVELAIDDPEWAEAVMAWCNAHLQTKVRGHKDIVFWGIYNSEPQSDEYEAEEECPNCKNGTLEENGDELVCRGECGTIL